MANLKRKIKRGKDNRNFLEHVRKGTFTENMVAEQVVRYRNSDKVDKRHLPRFKEINKTTGYCSYCGKRSYPFKTCRDCRETAQIRTEVNRGIKRGEYICNGREGKSKIYSRC